MTDLSAEVAALRELCKAKDERILGLQQVIANQVEQLAILRDALKLLRTAVDKKEVLKPEPLQEDGA